MKRLPLLLSFLIFIALCMSLSYWGMQVFKPAVRAVSAPVAAATFEPGVGQWGSAFGRNPVAEVAASNYQVKGVVVAAVARDSAAIISADGKPALTIAVEHELSPGVKLVEVHETYILISEGGLIKRIEIPQSVSPSAGGIQIFTPAPATQMMGVNPGGPVNNQNLPTASLPQALDNSR